MRAEGLDELELEVAADGDHATITIGGELDTASAPRLISAAHDLVEQNLAVIDLDCDDVWFLDSAGVRSLIVARNEAARMGIDLAIVRASQTVARILDLTGLTPTLTRPSAN